jgi:hypothetical protein
MLFASVCNKCYPRSTKRVIRSDKPITSVFPVKSQKCDLGAKPRSLSLICDIGRERVNPILSKLILNLSKAL